MAIDKNKAAAGRKFERRLRSNATKAEKHFKKLITQIKKRYNLQFTMKFQKGWYEGPAFYISDFYFPRTRITIELDGMQHYHDLRVVAQDLAKEDYLKTLKIRTFRLENSEILRFTCDELLQYLVEKRVI